MVDVSEKPVTRRSAIALATVKMQPSTLDRVLSGNMPKGDVFACARIAGIMAAKRTSELIPLCHPIQLTNIQVEIQPNPPDQIEIRAEAACVGVTGVEMEALCAASVAALTIYDMCKAIDRGMEITRVTLTEKRGGSSGVYKKLDVEN